MLRTPRGRGRDVSIAFDAAAQKAGMVKTKLRHMGNTYAMGEGDLFPVFFPHYVGRWGATSIGGNIGLYVKPFEYWWADLIDKFEKKKFGIEGPVLSIYISNFPSITTGETFLSTETAEIEEWAAKIVDLSLKIFEPGRDIFEIICSKKLADFDLSWYLWCGVKSYAFNIWLHLQRPDMETPDKLKLLDEQRISFREQEYNFLKLHYGHIDP